MEPVFFDLDRYRWIELNGPEASDYLHRLSTVNIENLPSGELVHCAFLNAKSGIESLGVLLRLSKTHFRYMIPATELTQSYDHLDKFKFAEQFELTICETLVFGFLDTAGTGMVRMGFPENAQPLKQYPLKIPNVESSAWRDDWRPSLYWITIDNTTGHNKEAWLETMQKIQCKQATASNFERLRIEAGIAEMGIEANSSMLALEVAPHAVAENKGCYPGQETVERIRTYGQVNRKLMRLRGTAAECDPKAPLLAEDKAAGQLLSCVQASDGSSDVMALGLVKKAYWEFSGDFTTQDGAHFRLEGQ